MSASQHEQHAAAEEHSASQHEEHYDPGARAETTRCAERLPKGDPVCWAVVENPTDAHLAQAAQHRKAAADHRAASAALREAEAKACGGLSDDNRDMSPFVHLGDIASVAPLKRSEQLGKQSRERTVGATVTFRAVPGMTAEWLQRLVDCHIARSAAMGHDMPEMPYCPLVPKGVHALVRSTGAGFAVEISGEDDATAAEVLRRAQALKPGAGAESSSH